MTINPQAIDKLKELHREFGRAFHAASQIRDPDSFDARLGGSISPVPDEAQGRRLMGEYASYGRAVSFAITHLVDGEDDKAQVVSVLKDLKNHFDRASAHWQEASRSIFATKYEEKKLAQTYAGYSRKVDSVLKLI